MSDQWYWTDADTAVRLGKSFATQSDAEAFMSEHWEKLADDNIKNVTLWCDGREVYGPMPLTPLG